MQTLPNKRQLAYNKLSLLMRQLRKCIGRYIAQQKKLACKKQIKFVTKTVKKIYR